MTLLKESVVVHFYMLENAFQNILKGVNYVFQT